MIATTFLSLSQHQQQQSDKERPNETKEEDSEGESDDDDEALISNLTSLAFATNKSSMKRTTRIPVKANAASSSRALVFPSTSSVVSTGATGPDGLQGHHDEVKKFCAEGTPSWVSKSNSQTNLSLSFDNDDLKGSDDSDDSADELLQGLVKKAWDANPPKAVPVPAARRSSSKLGQRVAGEGIPTTQANRGLGGITTIPCPTPAASTPHRHGKGIACSTTTTSNDKPR